MKYLTIGLLFLSVHAHAGFIHSYTFEVTAINGSLAGQTSTGTLIYDDNGLSDIGLLGVTFSFVDFLWNGIQYTRDSVLGGAIRLGADGSITDIAGSFFGTNCGTGTCGVNAMTEGWQLDLLSFAIPTFGDTIFKYGTPGQSTIGQGTVEWTYNGIIGENWDNDVIPKESVPEPATFGMLLAGLLSMVIFRRLRWRSSSP